MKKMFFALLLALGLALTAGLASGQEPGLPTIVSVAKADLRLETARLLDLDLLMEVEGRVYVVASPADLQKIKSAGISFRLEAGLSTPFASGLPRVQGDLNGDFHSYIEVESELKAMETAHPSQAKVFDLGDSLEGRHIYALKISANVQLDEDEARVLFLGCHHAREWISVEVPFLYGKYLLENYGSNPEVTRLVDNSEIWIVPLVNPDGLEYSIHSYRYWRKNRRENGDGSWGVDLNRNYSYAWAWDNIGSSPAPDSDVYRGRSPFSEPETGIVRDLISSRKFQALISYHSYAQDILYPWGYTSMLTPDDARLRSLAAGMAQRIQAVNGRVYTYGAAADTLYVTNGELTDWAYGTYGILAYTIEVPPLSAQDGGFFNAEADIQPIFQENLPAMTYLIDQCIAGFVPAAAIASGRDMKPAPAPRPNIRVKG
jgi:carboxypeptidase T